MNAAPFTLSFVGLAFAGAAGFVFFAATGFVFVAALGFATALTFGAAFFAARRSADISECGSTGGAGGGFGAPRRMSAEFSDGGIGTSWAM
jgi:hypothetical protein